MDTKKIRALLTAAEKGSLTAAAEELGYTQSGMTHMMNALENELMLKLLIRSKSGVCLSPEAQVLLDKFKALVQAGEELEMAAEMLREENFQNLRIGAYSSVMRNWMFSVLSEFRSASPETKVSLDAGSIMQVYDWVRSGIVDCGIASYQQNQMQGLYWVPLRDDALVAVLPAGYADNLEAFPVKEFSGREFIMPADNFDWDINPVFNMCPQKVCPMISYTNMDDAAVISMVKNGLGISMLSELVVRGMSDGVKILPLLPPANRSLGILVPEKRKNENNIRQFILCIKSALSKMYPD